MPGDFRSDRERRRLGSLTVYCGPTHSGKTRKLEAEAERARRQGRSVHQFAAGASRSASRSASRPEVETIADAAAVVRALKPSTELVTIDDAQALGEDLTIVAEELATVARMDVVVAGWEMDFQGRPAGPLPALLCLADVVIKLGDGVCAQPDCRNLASRTQRFATENGGEARFVPVCRRHHDPEGKLAAQQEGWFAEPCGLLDVIAGCMFSGKTLELIRRLDQERYAGASVRVFKPAVDTRYAESDVASHRDLRFPATAVGHAGEIPALLPAGTLVIGIDEVQFFGAEIATLAEQWAGAGRHVLLAGLELDFLGRPFGQMPALMAQADRLTKLQASCQFPGCGSRQATRTQRLVDGKPA